MHVRRVMPLLAVILLSGSHVTGSFAAGPPEPGTRVRLTAKVPERRTWVGPLVSIAGDTLTMHRDSLSGALVAVPALHVERFEVSQGVHGNIGRGALAGGVVGALLGAAVGYYAMKDTYSPGAGAAAGAALGAALGAVIGISNEARSPSEQWRKLPPEEWRVTTRL